MQVQGRGRVAQENDTTKAEEIGVMNRYNDGFEYDEQS